MKESINLDDPRFTDYVLGELPGKDRESFESLIGGSDVAQKELDATRDFADLLSDALEREWRTEVFREPVFEVIEGGAGRDDNDSIVEHDFGRAREESRRPVLLSLAAVLAGLLVVGAMALGQRGSVQNLASNGEANWAGDPGEALLASTDSGDTFAPSLFLVEELPDSLDPLEGSLLGRTPLDSSYLSGSGSLGGMVNVGYGASDPALLGLVPGRSPLNRLDSYLPPVQEGNVTLRVREGQIDGQAAKSYLVTDRRLHENGLESILVKGIVTVSDSDAIDIDAMLAPGLSEIGFGSVEDTRPSSEQVEREMNRFQTQLESLIEEIDASSEMDEEAFGSLKGKLNQLLEQHRELGNQINPRP